MKTTAGEMRMDARTPRRSKMSPQRLPRGDPFNVGQMYALFAEAIRTGQSRLPTFDTAVDLHRFIDTIKQASETGQALPSAAERPWTPGGA